MHTQQSQPEPDVLRARFTCWLEVLVYRARSKYLRKEEHRIKTISLDDLPEEQWPIAPAPVLRETEFDFEEERLARAFSKLSVERQKLLTLVFLYELKPEEAAEVLHYSIKNSTITNMKLSKSSVQCFLTRRILMKDKEFRSALTAAVAGDHDDLELILRLYAPLIDRYSIVDGRLNEDLRQYIMIHIAQNISKFPL